MTAYFPFVLTLFRFPSSDDGVFAAASFTIVLFVTRSNENFTSVESNAEPSLNVTPRRRLQRHVVRLPTEKHFVASDGSSFGPCRKSSRCSKTLLVERERPVVVRSRGIDVRDRVRRPVDEGARRWHSAECGLPRAGAESDDDKCDHGAQRADPPAHRSSFHVVPFLPPAIAGGTDRSPREYDAAGCRKVGIGQARRLRGGSRSRTHHDRGAYVIDRGGRRLVRDVFPRSSETVACDLKGHARRADTGHVDAAERKEILNRYRDHSRRFEAAAARRSSTPPRSGHPVHAAVDARGRSGSDRARDRGAAARRGRPRQSRDRRTALPLGRDGEVTRPPSAREASSAKQSPRRSGWLPAWAHCVATSVRQHPTPPSGPFPRGYPRKRDAHPRRRTEDATELPDLSRPWP